MYYDRINDIENAKENLIKTIEGKMFAINNAEIKEAIEKYRKRIEEEKNELKKKEIFD